MYNDEEKIKYVDLSGDEPIELSTSKNTQKKSSNNVKYKKQSIRPGRRNFLGTILIVLIVIYFGYTYVWPMIVPTKIKMDNNLQFTKEMMAEEFDTTVEEQKDGAKAVPHGGLDVKVFKCKDIYVMESYIGNVVGYYWTDEDYTLFGIDMGKTRDAIEKKLQKSYIYDYYYEDSSREDYTDLYYYDDVNKTCLVLTIAPGGKVSGMGYYKSAFGIVNGLTQK